MVKIVLESGVLDVSENVNFPITFSIAEIKDVSVRKGTFSKSITLPGTDNNHQLLGHYYDVNIQEGTFNINTLTHCQVIQNDVPILEDVLLQLVSVDKIQTASNYEQQITYTVLIKDTKAEFFSSITNKELNDLDFSDCNHEWSAATIVNTFAHDVTKKFKYVMPQCFDVNNYQINEFKPAIYAKVYFDRIFATAGFSYTWADLEAANFDKLLIPYNGDVNNFDFSDFLVQATNTWTTSYVQPVGRNYDFAEDVNSGWFEVIDAQNLFDPAVGEYTSPFDTNSQAAQHYQYEIQVTGDLILDNSSGADARLIGSGPLIFQPTDLVKNVYNIQFKVNVNGSGNVIVNGTQKFTVVGDPANPTPLPNGQTVIGTISDTITFTAIGNGTGLPYTISPGDIQVTVVGVRIINMNLNNQAQLPSINNYTKWVDHATATTPVQVDVIADLNLSLKILPSSNLIPIGQTIIINDYIPKKIKQSDFVKSILKMYNLYVEQDEDNPYNLILRHRDEYYDSGQEKDWSSKIAKDKDQSLTFLPDITKKKIRLTYTPDKDPYNEAYTNATAETYGQVEYTYDNEYVKDVDIQSIIFSPTPIGRTLFEAYVPLINGAAPKTQLRILFDGGLATCNAYNIYEYGTTGAIGETQYPMLGHFNNALLPTFDINFGVNDFYFYQVQSLTPNNLYNLYWRRTINQINTGKMLTAFFNLNESDIQSLKLNDKIYINNSWWNINKIQDYNAQQKGLTKVELISVDQDIDLAPVQTGNGLILDDVNSAGAILALAQQSSEVNNVVLRGASATIIGKGNVVSSGVSGIIVGNNKSLESNGIAADNINGTPQVYYKKYCATITQTGTNDPVVTVLENTIGDIVWTRVITGFYEGTLAGAFTSDKTLVFIGVEIDITQARRNTDDIVSILTMADSILDQTASEIRVYE